LDVWLAEMEAAVTYCRLFFTSARWNLSTTAPKQMVENTIISTEKCFPGVKNVVPLLPLVLGALTFTMTTIGKQAS
jgi:hypothetical protein